MRHTRIQKIPKSLLSLFFSYLKKPNYNIEQSTKSIRGKVWDIICLWALISSAVVIFSLLTERLLLFFNFDYTDNAIFDIFEQTNIVSFALIAMIWAPISEEYVFRLALRYSPYRLGISLSFMFWIFVDLFIYIFPKLERFLYTSLSKWQLILLWIVFIVSSSLLLGNFFSKKFKKEKVNAWYKKQFPYIFYIVALLFAVFHIFNFNDLSKALYLLPLLIAPQFFAALMIGFVRMRYGFTWAIFSHFIYNSLLILPVIIFSYASPALTNFSDESITSVPSKLSNQDNLVVVLLATVLLILFLLIVFSLASLFFDYQDVRAREKRQIKTLLKDK